MVCFCMEEGSVVAKTIISEPCSNPVRTGKVGLDGNQTVALRQNAESVLRT